MSALNWALPMKIKAQIFAPELKLFINSEYALKILGPINKHYFSNSPMRRLTQKLLNDAFLNTKGFKILMTLKTVWPGDFRLSLGLWFLKVLKPKRSRKLGEFPFPSVVKISWVATR